MRGVKAITNDQIRQRILDSLAKKGMSTKDLINATGDNLNLYKYLNGNTRTISADRIGKIAIALGVSCDYILVEDDKCFQLELEKNKILQKVEELKEVLRQSRENSYGIPDLPSREKARADYLRERAIELVEEITDEKWEFSYRVFG